MARNQTQDLTILQMALIGYQSEREKINSKIHEIEAQLKGKHVPMSSSNGEKPAGPKRILSPAARKRIALAQKKRWAEHRKRVAAAAKAE